MTSRIFIHHSMGFLQSNRKYQNSFNLTEWRANVYNVSGISYIEWHNTCLSYFSFIFFLKKWEFHSWFRVRQFGKKNDCVFTRLRNVDNGNKDDEDELRAAAEYSVKLNGNCRHSAVLLIDCWQGCVDIDTDAQMYDKIPLIRSMVFVPLSLLSFTGLDFQWKTMTSVSMLESQPLIISHETSQQWKRKTLSPN